MPDTIMNFAKKKTSSNGSSIRNNFVWQEFRFLHNPCEIEILLLFFLFGKGQEVNSAPNRSISLRACAWYVSIRLAFYTLRRHHLVESLFGSQAVNYALLTLQYNKRQ